MVSSGGVGLHGGVGWQGRDEGQAGRSTHIIVLYVSSCHGVECQVWGWCLSSCRLGVVGVGVVGVGVLDVGVVGLGGLCS